MADKVPMEFSPFVGPDSLRQTTHLLKNLYDVHTKRYCGYKDINGSQYEGTLENWGSEMLLESRKMLMDKPALENIFIENTLDFYFDIQYSNIIDNDNQQNMLCGVLRKDVLLSNRQYSITFNDIEKVRYPRSRGYSDPTVYVDEYIHTTIPPKLVMTYPDDTVEEIPLKLTDKTGAVTDYYFHLSEDTVGMYDPDSIPESGDFNVEINNSHVGFPCIWMVVNLLRTLPTIGLVNNEFGGKELFEIGTNGHDNAYMYPLFNNEMEDFGDHTFILKVLPGRNDSFYPINNNYNETPNEDKSKIDYNFSTKIKEIHLLEYDGIIAEFPPPQESFISDTLITYNDTNVKMSLHKFSSSAAISICSGKWFFRTPQPGDPDYDGTTYKNKCYAYTDLKSFMYNITSQAWDRSIPTPGFKINYNSNYVHPYKGYCENAYTGVHVDVTSDYSNNGVSKKNGTIHGMGDFDGLPPYFRYNINKTMHRAHVEIYAIRDKLNAYKYDSVATRKQTAGIIVDSALPQNQIVDPGDMPIVIYYPIDRSRIYTYDSSDPNISKTNSASEITFADPYNFGNSKILKYSAQKKFIYHGNRHFSLGLVGFDPENETGRVYIISNDSSSYENNQLTNSKSPRTFARICDIPTKFAQLVGIPGEAPTFVMDPDYIRTEAPYSTSDRSVVYNKELMEKVLKINHDIIQKQIPSNPQTIVNTIGVCDLYKYTNLNCYIDLANHDVATFSVGSGGSGYEEGDMFIFYIGGITVRGKVKTATDGVVSEVQYGYKDSDGEIQYDDDWSLVFTEPINRSNLKNQVSTYKTESLDNSNDKVGLTIKVEIIDQTVWGETAGPIRNGFADDIYCLSLDGFNNIWVWLFDSNTQTLVKHNQITGEITYDNAYDDPTTLPTYNTKDVFLYNALKQISSDYILSKTKETDNLSNISTTEIPDITSPDNLSNRINELTINDQDCLFVIGDPLGSGLNYNIIKHERDIIKTSQKVKDLIIPSYSDLGYMSYTNKSNKLRFESSSSNSQPELWIYNPMAETLISYENAMIPGMRIFKDETPILLSDIIENSSRMRDITYDSASGTLLRNVYISDEYTTNDLDNKRSMYETYYTRDALVDLIRRTISDSEVLLFEGTPYEYTKERIINYLISKESMLPRGYSASYTKRPGTLYRRPPVRLFRTSGSEITSKSGEPVGPQPTGRFDNVTRSIFDPRITIGDRYNEKADPLFFFRVDDKEIKSKLNSFRLYDQDNNDISKYSVLLIDGFFYAFKENKWIVVSTNENTPKEGNDT